MQCTLERQKTQRSVEVGLEIQSQLLATLQPVAGLAARLDAVREGIPGAGVTAAAAAALKDVAEAVASILASEESIKVALGRRFAKAQSCSQL